MKQREIKFRAWKVDQDGSYMIPFEKMLSDAWNMTSLNANGFKMMQFTGLKDKNGREIYEGDIIKAHDHPTGVDDALGDVYYDQGCWKLRNGLPILPDYGTAWTEVIGNIYENPELLKL